MAPNFQNGKIYCLRVRNDGDKIVYVGSTVRPLSERMGEHRKNVKVHPERKVYKLLAEVGVDNVYIELMHAFPCNTREELHAEEGRHMRIHRTAIEGGCNVKVAGRKAPEFRAEHPEIQQTRNKAYYNENCEVLKAQSRAYYTANRSNRLEKNKAYYDANRETINKQQQAYHVAHREKDNDWVKKWRAAQREKFNALPPLEQEKIRSAKAQRQREQRAAKRAAVAEPALAPAPAE